MTSGFLYQPGQLFRTITLGDPQHQTDKSSIRILLDNSTTTLVLTPELANTLMVLLAQRLYDDGAMDMAAADKVSYLSTAALMDRAEYAEIVAMSNGEDF